jgi:hypothetical protein
MIVENSKYGLDAQRRRFITTPHCGSNWNALPTDQIALIRAAYGSVGRLLRQGELSAPSFNVRCASFDHLAGPASGSGRSPTTVLLRRTRPHLASTRSGD